MTVPGVFDSTERLIQENRWTLVREGIEEMVDIN